MRAPVRLGLYGLALIVVFVVAAVTAGALVPEQTSQSWVQDTAESGHRAPKEDALAPAGKGHQGGEAPLDLGVAKVADKLSDLPGPTGTSVTVDRHTPLRS